MTELHAEPDFESAIIAYLKSCPALVALVAEAGRISTKLRRRQDTLLTPALRIYRIGGLPTEQSAGHLIRARFQAEAYADTTPAAFAIASQADLELRRLNGSSGGIVFSAYRKELGITYSEDPDSNAERYVFGPVLYGHASPA